MKISVIVPLEESRLELFFKTLSRYNKGDIEFVLVSRSIPRDLDIILEKQYPGIDINIVYYEWKEPTFNCAKALNLGVMHSKHPNIIITSPEVKPVTNVIEQFRKLGRGNYVAQVWDMNKDGSRKLSLVNKKFRGDTPGMYFLAMFKKEDLLRINGWDEDFMYGYAYEDNDFGTRFVRAGIPFQVREEIEAEHQWHPRYSDIADFRQEYKHNLDLWNKNNKEGVVCPKNGIIKM